MGVRLSGATVVFAGVGSRFLAHAEDSLFARGHKTIRLKTFDGNDQAIGFYMKNGWSVTGRQEDREHGFTRVIFEKKAPVVNHETAE